MSGGALSGTGGLASSVKTGRQADWRKQKTAEDGREVWESKRRQEVARAESHKQYSPAEMQAAMAAFEARNK